MDRLRTHAIRIVVAAACFGLCAGNAVAVSGPASQGPAGASAKSLGHAAAKQTALQEDGASAGDGPCPPEVQYHYRSAAAAEFVRLSRPDARPPDLATVSGPGRTSVPYVVRIEMGSVAGSCYGIAMLHDPAREPSPDAVRRSSGWNGRLVYIFSGDCGAGAGALRHAGGILNDDLLRRGYAIATAINGNDPHARRPTGILAQLKARFVRRYGEPRHTIGLGCPGLEDLDAAAERGDPGPLDGAVLTWSPREALLASLQTIGDARVLVSYFDRLTPGTLAESQQRAIAGTHDLAALRRIADSLMKIPASRLARLTFDNDGVQYGLNALNSGAITVSQSLDLNEGVGGIDRQGAVTRDRSTADANGLWMANYAARLSSRGEALRDLPTIDYHAYEDEPTGASMHLRAHSLAMRARLQQAGGDPGHSLIWVEAATTQEGAPLSRMLLRALDEIDRWIEAVKADTPDRPLQQRLVARKPAGLRDGCSVPQGELRFIAASAHTQAVRCEDLYPVAPRPREIAGASPAADVVKCPLRPVSAGDYTPRLTSAEITRLAAIFPRGVCHWPAP